jgi:hypothetical protein
MYWGTSAACIILKLFRFSVFIWYVLFCVDVHRVASKASFARSPVLNNKAQRAFIPSVPCSSARLFTICKTSRIFDMGVIKIFFIK